MTTCDFEKYIAERSGESIYKVRQCAALFCDYKEEGGNPSDDSATLKFVAKHTSIAVPSIVRIYAEYVSLLVANQHEGMEFDHSDYRRVRAWADVILAPSRGL